MKKETKDMMFGPHKCTDALIPTGIFGLGHEELMESKWKIEDSLTAKMNVDLKPDCAYDEKILCRSVLVPPSNIGDNLLTMLNTGLISDILCVVQGEWILAHSAILAARSEVWQ